MCDLRGRGVDVVYDSVGRDTWRGSIASPRTPGMFVCFGQSRGVVEGFGLGDLAAGASGAGGSAYDRAERPCPVVTG
ncbi:MAG: hypothetical protein ABTQ27_11000 [Amaricoccus sp.]|uniref:hypothetical protein n=1 Tax=Amaricoccus sp. TaxID=1872485 RepID=UPI00331505D8